MKKIYIIQYELEEDLILKERIKSLGAWISYFPKSWVVESDLSPLQIYNKLSADYAKARIFIIELNTSHYYGMMPTELWDWLTERKNLK
nr:DUF3884 family protein [uncultured Pedobacter sp.]